jgi:glucose 1-dehydrogenase
MDLARMDILRAVRASGRLAGGVGSKAVFPLLGRGCALRLKDKVAVVTGAATGIGQAIAVAFAEEGASVVVDYIGNVSASEETMGKIAAAGGKAIAVNADISLPNQVDDLVQKTIAAYGKLDIFLNNAGIEKGFAFVDCPLDEWQKIIAVNLTGPFLCSQAAARQMIRQGKGGRIINISSVHEDLPFLMNAPYCASKGGLRMLMRTIAVELAPHQITVNNIGPDAIYTPINKDVRSDPKLNDQLMSQIPLGRWAQPNEVARLAVYLASEDAAYVTGSTYFIDGGMLRNAGSL